MGLLSLHNNVSLVLLIYLFFISIDIGISTHTKHTNIINICVYTYIHTAYYILFICDIPECILHLCVYTFIIKNWLMRLWRLRSPTVCCPPAKTQESQRVASSPSAKTWGPGDRIDGVSSSLSAGVTTTKVWKSWVSGVSSPSPVLFYWGLD